MKTKWLDGINITKNEKINNQKDNSVSKENVKKKNLGFRRKQKLAVKSKLQQNKATKSKRNNQNPCMASSGNPKTQTLILTSDWKRETPWQKERNRNEYLIKSTNKIFQKCAKTSLRFSLAFPLYGLNVLHAREKG